MLEYQGKYTTCSVMIDEIEEEAVQQIYRFLNSPAFEGAKIRIMPDVHAGAGAVVGFTSTLTDKVIPNVIGVDIGCGVSSICLGPLENIDFAALDRFIRENIPSGFSVREKPLALDAQLRNEVQAVSNATEQDTSRVMRSVGTLGGGNHFIEVGKDEYNDCWLTVHTGSRNFGLKIANFHQAKAVRTVGKGHGLEWLEGEAKNQYLEHMQVAQRFAAVNRSRILVHIIEGFFQGRATKRVDSVHNYIDFGDGVIRKGAIAANKGQRVIIPWNMRDGLIIGKGKGNSEWNYSAPHGAGRVLGRGQAKRALQLEDFEASMEGIWTSCVGKDTIDESPMAYKPAEVIMAAIGDTIEVERVVKPVYNFKAV